MMTKSCSMRITSLAFLISIMSASAETIATAQAFVNKFNADYEKRFVQPAARE